MTAPLTVQQAPALATQSSGTDAGPYTAWLERAAMGKEKRKEEKKKRKQLETISQRCAKDSTELRNGTDKGMKRSVQESSMPRGSAEGKAPQQQAPPSTGQRAPFRSQVGRHAPRMNHHRASTAQEKAGRIWRADRR